MCAFDAIILVSGYGPAPRRKMYWFHDEDVHNEAIAASITRNRFCEMMKYLMSVIMQIFKRMPK